MLVNAAVKLTHRAFVFWWVVILAVHVVTCVYNALYSYAYWLLASTFLNLYLESLQIGMPPPYHQTIAAVNAAMSAVHGVCVLLMLGGSLWQRSLAFTPWSSCVADSDNEDATKVRSSTVFQSLSTIYDRATAPFAVESDYFYAVLICREVVETALQTAQAHRMSILLPRVILNRFYVVVLAVNCLSAVILHSFFFKNNEPRRRFACIVLDCTLDLVACMGVESIVLLSYMSDYKPKVRGFPETIWYDDEWAAHALNEFQMIVVVSWWDLARRTIFSIGLAMTTASLKTLMWQLPNDGATSAKMNAVGPIPVSVPQQKPKREAALKPGQVKMCSRAGKLLRNSIHVLFGLWGILVLGLHIQASLQPTLPQCLMQVRPWGVTRPSCYLVGLDCYRLGIDGKMAEVEEKWSEFDSSTVVQLLIRHWPILEMPTLFTDVRGLHNIKVYNTTIADWGESAAITNTNHPGMSSLMIVRVNMTDGLLPMGFQSTEFPQTLYDFEFCVTNLRTLPDGLDTKWPLYSIIQLEYGQIRRALTGNPISEIPPEVFDVQGMLFLSISNMKIAELPQHVTQLSSELSWIFIGDTNISFFWAWTDELVERMKGRANPWLAGPSPYCDDLEKIVNGTATAFSVPLSPEYSQTLMDPSEANRNVILKAVRCDPTIQGLFYSLEMEDNNNAISTPPPLARQG